MSRKKSPDKMSFEDAMSRLEEIVDQLDEGHRSLKESLELFEEGQALARRCQDELDGTEERIAVLLSRGDGSAEVAVDLSDEDDVTESLSAALDGGDDPDDE